MMTAPHRCPSCRTLHRARRCVVCTKRQDRQRGTSTQRGYNSARWKALRLSILIERRYQCSACHLYNATDVDHLVAVDGPDDPLFWQRSNLDAKCHACHSRKTVAIDGGFGHQPLPGVGP